MLKSVINARDLLRTFISLGVYLIPCLVHGHLLNGTQILQDHFPELWEIEDGLWLELTTSRCGWRLGHYPILGTQTQKILFERTLLFDLGFLTPPSRITSSSLRVKFSRDTAVNQALGTNIQLQPIRKEIGKLKQLTKSQ